MGIKRKVTESIRVASLTCDTAIDQGKTPVLQYIESRDPKLLKPVPGESITFFTLDVLPGERADFIRSQPSPVRERIAFQVGCSACTDPDLLPPDAWELAGERRRIAQKYMEQLPDDLPRELGAIVLKLGELSLGEEPRFGPLAGSLAIPKRQRNTIADSAKDKDEQEGKSS